MYKFITEHIYIHHITILSKYSNVSVKVKIAQELGVWEYAEINTYKGSPDIKKNGKKR